MRPAVHDSQIPLLIVYGWAGGDTGRVKNSSRGYMQPRRRDSPFSWAPLGPLSGCTTTIDVP
eukprot:2379278-Pyramimonas_sp.AAC.1